MSRPTALLCAFAFGAALVLAASCGGDDSNAVATPTLPVVEVRYDGGVIRAELANTPETRERGLGGRASLPEDAGMLFDFGYSLVPSFWMKGMSIPLDMVWIDENKRVAGITADVQPEPGVADGELRQYAPGQAVRYVLELNAGAAARFGISPGDELEFEIP